MLYVAMEVRGMEKRLWGGGVVADICTTYRAFSALPFVLAVCFNDKELGEGENEI